MIPIFAGSDLGWVTAMGAVFVIVVMVAAGIIRVDIVLVGHYNNINSVSAYQLCLVVLLELKKL